MLFCKDYLFLQLQHRLNDKSIWYVLIGISIAFNELAAFRYYVNWMRFRADGLCDKTNILHHMYEVNIK